MWIGINPHNVQPRKTLHNMLFNFLPSALTLAIILQYGVFADPSPSAVLKLARDTAFYKFPAHGFKCTFPEGGVGTWAVADLKQTIQHAESILVKPEDDPVRAQSGAVSATWSQLIHTKPGAFSGPFPMSGTSIRLQFITVHSAKRGPGINTVTLYGSPDVSGEESNDWSYWR